MPEYTRNDIPLVHEAINSARRQIDHAEAEIVSWEQSRHDACDRWKFWNDIMAAINKMERK